jgi:spore maturation protein CgeB
MNQPKNIVILGLSITSSWGNGHATTYRSLVRALAANGHRILFLERDVPWYAGNRDTPHPAGARTHLYNDLDELMAQFEQPVADADLVIVGSFVPEGTRAGEWVTSVARGVTAFYDIDTPVTLARLAEGCHDYISPDLIRRYDLYLSFTGGPTLRRIESEYGSPMARELYCSVDTESYCPAPTEARWDLGYLGTYSDDRQPTLDSLLLEPARRWPEGSFAVAGPMYPEHIEWPSNVSHTIHLAPAQHAAFYGSQRYTLNVTREAMKRAGWSPSVRLFEAGACGVPVISDWWEGLDSIFRPGREILVAEGPEETLRILRDYPESARLALGDAARRRILAEHTSPKRAAELERYLKEFHDHFSPDSARRNRSLGSFAGGLAPRLASQSVRPDAGGETGGHAGKTSHPGRVYQSAGARR